MKPIPRPLLETLEERILYSADPGPAGLVAAVAGIDHQVQDATPADVRGTELVFVDSRSPDRQQLLDDFAAQQQAGRQLEVVVVDASDDGIGAISRSLEGRSDVSAIHIVGHGEAGSAQLGASRFDSQTLLLRAGEIAAWSNALAADADLLLYGCDVGATQAGQDLVKGLAQLTGADVAASDDPTGNGLLGGDWQLEVRSGQIDAASAVSATEQTSWLGLLNTYTVTNTADSGAGSLRQAIIDANANSGADSIDFAISGTGVHTITLSSALPTITDTVSINGATEPGYAGSPLISINGGNSISNMLTLDAGSSGSTLRGLNLQNFTGYGIYINGSSNNTIAGNYLGTNAAGDAPAGTSTNPIVINNGNNNLIGGSTAADRNVIAGNYYSGLLSEGTSTGNLIRGNYFGINAAGTAIVGSAIIQIEMASPGNTIGGSGAGQGNVISGKLTDVWDFIDLWEAASNTVIQGNIIGLNAAGTAALTSSGNDGIYIRSNNNLIGGTNPGEGNVIGGVVKYGIHIANSGSGGSNNTIQGNYIGTDISGSITIANGLGGVAIDTNANGNLIGGVVAGAGNLIAGNTGNGVLIRSGAGSGNSILGNSISNSSALGINLQGGTENGSGVTANDVGDADTGPNNLQNYPVITLAKSNGSGQVTVAGTLNSTANSYFRVEFFASPGGDASGYGEGKTYLGFLNIATDGSGNASFSGSFGMTVPVGYVLSATATRSDASHTSFSDTSEFARNVEIISSVQGNLVVDTAGDTSDGDTTSLSTLLANKGADGKVSLREAITATNNTANGSGGADVISFAIGTQGSTQTINLASVLPFVNDTVIVDGRSQGGTGYSGVPLIVLNGGGSIQDGLEFYGAGAGGSVVKGLVIRNFAQDGIDIAGADGVSVIGNYIGTNAAGSAASGNQQGVNVWNSNNVVIGGSAATDRNVISGNSLGVLFTGTSSGGLVQGNYIGINAAGTAKLANSNSGVALQSASSTHQTINANVISGNGGAGVAIDGSVGTAGNLITGNLIGLNAAGSAALGNSGAGVYIYGGSPDNVIGGTTAAERNIISGNANGVLLDGSGTTGNQIIGNYIGTNLAGTSALGNTFDGIRLQNGASNTTVGGSAAGQRNIISGNGDDGIEVWQEASDGNRIVGNWIGVSAGSTLLGNVNDGVFIADGADNTVVGGSGVGEGNWIAGYGKVGVEIDGATTGSLIQGNRIGTDLAGTANWGGQQAGVLIENTYATAAPSGNSVTDNVIAFSGQGGGNYSAGIVVADTAGTGNPLLRNLIYGSGGLGIDLNSNNNVQANDTGDADSGPNDLQNYPVLTSAFLSGSDTTVTGTLNSTASTSYRIEFFASPTADASGHGEASTYLGFVNVTTNASGDASFTATLSGVLVPAGHAVTATATATVDAGGGSYGSTSEFSANVLLVTNTAPTITQGATIGMGADYPEDSASAGFPVFGVIGAVNWSDPDAGAVRGMALTSTTGNGTWQYSTDLATWHDVGAVSGSNALLLSDTSWLRYVGDGANAESPTIQFRAWDMSSGTASTNAAPSYVSPDAGGGTSAFSSQTANGFTVITGVNDAPVLTPASPVLAGITEDQTSNGGQTVASILGASVSDVDDGAQQGIAVVATTDGNGSWQFSTNDGVSWSAVGAVSDGNALLLRAEDKIRFVPDGLNGTSASISYRAWDQSSGAAGSKADSSSNGGTTAFSVVTDSASLTVSAVNDAPVISSSGSASVAENTTAVLTVTATDADLPGQTLSYSISGGADAALFQIDANTGVLSFVSAPDFEAPADAGGNNVYDVIVQVSDGAGGSTSQAIAVTVTQANDNAPVITSSNTANVAENTTAALTVTATDSDLPGQPLSYSITGGADAAKFQIDANTGVLSFISAPDFEAPTDAGGNNVYDVTVQVSDGAGGSTSQAIAVTVTPANDNAPVITSSATASVVENSTAVLTVTATDADQPAQTLSYAITGGADAAKFQIDANTGVLSFLSAPDFETPADAGANNIYDVTVQVSDGAGGSTSQAIAVTVTPANDNAPVITSSATASVVENSTAVLTVTATDADQPTQTLSYAITGGADAAKFQIDANTGVLSFITAPDFEAPADAGGDNVYDVTVQVSDGASGSTSQAITVTVTPANDSAPVITSSATASVVENSTAVLTVTATDADLPSQTLSYSITGGADAAKFQIDANTGVLSFISAPDFEAPADAGANNVYDVTVQVSDGAGGSTSQAIAVTVTPANDSAPVITSSATASVTENTTAVLTVTATDADQPTQTLSYAITGGADAAKFQIDANTGVLSFVSAPDFEAPTDAGGNNIYDVTVQVSDGAGGNTSQAIAITVTPANDSAPVITSSATASVTENTTAVLTVTATDADLPSQTLSYSISGGADAAQFQIDANTGVLSFDSAPDFEAPTDAGGNNVYDVTVQVSDGAGGSTSQAIAVTVTPANDNAPVITSSATASVVENSTAVLTVTATDADLPAQTLSYSITGGADAALFQIDANTGVLSFITAPDFEAPADAGGDNVYDVTVQVSDGAGGNTSQAIAVTVTQANDNAPVITSSATASVVENSTAVLTVTATDADLPSQTLSYSITGGADAAKFQIDANTGVLSFITAPDFEAPADAGANNVYDVTVQVSDGAGGSTSQAIAVTVTPANDNAPVITSSATASVLENSTTVLTVTATDADLPGQPLSYSITGGADAAQFQIDANTGVLSFVSAPDFEAPTDADGDQRYEVVLTVSDGNLGSSVLLMVSVTDQGETPGGSDGRVLAREDEVYVFAASDLGLDPAASQPLSVQITALPSRGMLVLGDEAVAQGQWISQADIVGGRLGYLSPQDQNGSDYASFGFRLRDEASGLAGQGHSMVIDVVPLNDPPVLTSAVLEINRGGQTPVSADVLRIHDVDTSPGVLRLVVDQAEHGHFAYSTAPGTPVSQFSLADLESGRVIFVHDDSADLPIVRIHADDGQDSSPSLLMGISYLPVTGSMPTPPAVQTPPGVPAQELQQPAQPQQQGVTPPLATPTRPAAPEAASQGAEMPRQAGDGTATMPVPSSLAPDLPNGRHIITMTTLRLERAQIMLTLGHDIDGALMEFLLSGDAPGRSVGGGGEGGDRAAFVTGTTPSPRDDSAYADAQLALQAVRMTGFVLSIGTIWWAIRASGLVASMLMAAPAWITFDPLPVLGPKDKDEPHWGEADDSSSAPDEGNVEEMFELVDDRGAWS